MKIRFADPFAGRGGEKNRKFLGKGIHLPGRDPLVERAERDWAFLSDRNKLRTLAVIDRRAAKNELIRMWNEEMIHALRRDRGILDMGERFLAFMERDAPRTETAEELWQGADATLGYMVHDVQKLAEDRERFRRSYNGLNGKALSGKELEILERLGASDPAERIREYRAAGRSRDAARRREAHAALDAVVSANARAADIVKHGLDPAEGVKPPDPAGAEAEKIYPVLRAVLSERRFEALKQESLPCGELRTSLASWAGEIEERIIKVYCGDRGSEG